MRFFTVDWLMPNAREMLAFEKSVLLELGQDPQIDGIGFPIWTSRYDHRCPFVART